MAVEAAGLAAAALQPEEGTPQRRSAGTQRMRDLAADAAEQVCCPVQDRLSHISASENGA